MGEFDESVAIDDWMIPSPSPRTLFTSLIDDIASKSVSESIHDNRIVPHFSVPEVHGASGNKVENDGTMTSEVADGGNNLNSLSEMKVGSGGGLLERIAARTGFNAPRLNTESVRSSELSSNAEVMSPCLTIPLGLSPSTLLDSPVFLSNPLVLPSPTTGKFFMFPSSSKHTSSMVADGRVKNKENSFTDVSTSTFEFKPVSESGPFIYLNAPNEMNPFALSPQPFPSDQDSLHTENRSYSIESTVQYRNDENSSPLDEPTEDVEDHRNNEDPYASGGPSEDGYNWRKYGQKHVKGSEYPRSYYKCTHANCPVKKKVERSQEGQITEIIYEGVHNHPKPTPNLKSANGTSNAPGDILLDAEQCLIGGKDDHIWSHMQNSNLGWKQEEAEATSSAPFSHEYNSTAFQVQNGTQLESGGVGTTTFSNDDTENDRMTHGSASFVYEDEGEESESKRRKTEVYAPEMNGSSRAIREPRVVVQTTSDVDILDDGYRWRKYGQKVVKGNPNPRSYYKCTSTGCNVRKHVERASHDLKSVITTYEGKHNHDVPATRNSSHVGSNVVPAQQVSATASTHKHNPEAYQNQSRSAPMELPPFGSTGFSSQPLLSFPPGYLYRMNQPGLATMMAPNPGKLPTVPIHSYIRHQSNQVNIDAGSILSKGEPKLEPVLDSVLNTFASSSVYSPFINTLPPRTQM